MVSGMGHQQAAGRLAATQHTGHLRIANVKALVQQIRRACIRPQALHQRPALRRALAHDGPVLVDVVTAIQELVTPPSIKLEQAKGFSLYMLKAVMSGRGDEVIELARTNRLR